MKLTVVSVAAESLAALIRCYDKFQEKYEKDMLQLKAYYVAGSVKPQKVSEICEAVRGADTALIDLMGVQEALIDDVGSALEACSGNRIIIGYGCRDKLRLGKFAMSGKMKSKKDPGPDSKGSGQKMNSMRKMAQGMGKMLPLPVLKNMNDVFEIGDYWQSGLDEDIESMLYLLLREYYGFKKLPKPKKPHLETGIFICDTKTQKRYASADEYFKLYPKDSKKPTAAFLFYGHNYPNRFFPVIEEAKKGFEQFANVLPLGFSNQLDKDIVQLKKFLEEADVKLLVNFMSFRLGAGPMGGDAAAAVELLKTLDTPMLSPFFISKRTKEEWEQSRDGVNPGEFLISMMLPELDGGIETFPIGAVGNVSYDERFELDLTEIVPLDGAVSWLCRRAERWLRLRTLADSEKKIAFLCYDYPPGEEHMFSAAFLDTLKSLENILKSLHKKGYKTEELSAERLEAMLCGAGHINSARWHGEALDGIVYRPEKLLFSEAIEKQWGKAPGSIMAGDSGYRIPGIVSGNIFIGIQPARTGSTMDGDTHYHDENLPPHHQYAAYYQWLREEFRADVIVHVGTHGTLEFLPGRETGMTLDCWAARLIGEIPNLYLYYCGNASEGMIAKRRSNAVLLSYVPPAFKDSGLYGDYAALEALITEYKEAQKSAPERSKELKEKIERSAADLELPLEMEALENELYRSKTALIPYGLHVFGQPKSDEELKNLAGQAEAFSGEAWSDERKNAFYKSAGKDTEIEGLLHALEGGYVNAGPMGDVLRNPAVLPGGRNGFAFDARFVPSEAAYQRGERIAKAALEKYKKENGCLPKKTAVILWGLETARTQGETIGQILYYLGVRMVWKGTSFLSRLEIIPLEELGRPRIDVVVTICGFFRDMFPNLLADMQKIFKELAQLHEDEAKSAFAGQTNKLYRQLCGEGFSPSEAERLSQSRLFGPAKGEYGTSLRNIVKSGSWQDEAELGSLFTGELGFVYSEDHEGERIPGLIMKHFEAVDFISQVRSDAEYEVTDLDHYYEFFGGLSKAVENVRGVKAQQYVIDTASGGIFADTFSEAAGRGIRTRLLNPKWIDGLLAHSFHGAQKISERFENVLGLAATAGGITSSTFDRMDAVYVSDETIRKRMTENNRYAYIRLLERLMECEERGYWQATKEQLEELRQVYLDTEGEIEDVL